MKTALKNLVLTFTIALILALTSGCADNINFTIAGCVMPDGSIGIQTISGCRALSAHESNLMGGDYATK